MFRFHAALGALAFLVACGPPPDLKKSQVSRMSDTQLCQTYAAARGWGNTQHKLAARQELKARGAVTEQELKDISERVIRNGMREHIAVCAWGPYTEVNTTQVSGLSSRQFVLPLNRYFYTRNGLVYAWQS